MYYQWAWFEMEKRCACKGVRSCLLCEGAGHNAPPSGEVSVFTQCHLCGRLLEGAWSAERGARQCPVPCSVQKVWKPSLSLEDGLDFSGVTVIQEFITAEREGEMVAQIEAWPWAESQSGRRKQVLLLPHTCQPYTYTQTNSPTGLWAKGQLQAS